MARRFTTLPRHAPQKPILPKKPTRRGPGKGRLWCAARMQLEEELFAMAMEEFKEDLIHAAKMRAFNASKRRFSRAKRTTH